MSDVDVWITEFRPNPESPVHGLQRVIDVDEETARAIANTIPRVVKRSVQAKMAGEIRAALESIGAVVECRPAEVAKDPSHSREPVMEGEVAHFKSSPPDRGPTSRPPPAVGASKRLSITESLRAAANAEGREREMKFPIALAGVGLLTLTIAMFGGMSIFQGAAGVIATLIQAGGIFLIGYGAAEAYNRWRDHKEH